MDENSSHSKNINSAIYFYVRLFTAINVTERTASIGKDVSRQFAQQVQFNPGNFIIYRFSLKLAEEYCKRLIRIIRYFNICNILWI